MSSSGVAPEQVDAVMEAARGLVGVVATSPAAVEERVTLPQLRLLVLADGEGPLTLPEVVVAGLLDRRDNPADRRQGHRALTAQGRRLLTEVMEQRRRAVAAVLARRERRERDAVGAALGPFGAAARDVGGTHPVAPSWA